jgi:hypothetical protein
MDLEMLLRLQGSAAMSIVTNGGARELWAQTTLDWLAWSMWLLWLVY